MPVITRKMEGDLLVAEVDVDKRRHRGGLAGTNFWYTGDYFCVCIGWCCSFLNHPVVAGTICSITVVALVTVFVTGRQADTPSAANNDQPNEQLTEDST